MSWILIILGYTIIIITIVDILLTTIQCKGAGYLSNPISKMVWKALFSIAGKNGQSKLLNYAGLIVVLMVIFSWIFLIHLGFDLIYLSDPASIVTASKKLPTDVSDKIYFTSYTLFTMGNGDFLPSNDFFQITTALCTATGLFMITLSITYLIPIVSAVVEMRQLVSNIYFIGKTPKEWLNESWNGKDFKEIDSQLLEFNTHLSKHNERHRAYPVIHYFHSLDRKYVAALNIALLNECIIILSEAVPEEQRPKSFNLKHLHKNLENYSETLASQYGFEPKEIPDNPDLSEIEGIAYQNINYERYHRRRGILNTAVIKDGWTWDEILR